MARSVMNEDNSTRERQRWLDAAAAALVFILLLAVYLRTLLPGVGGTEDSPKFQYVGAALGTPHNPGYPLYMLACYAFSKLPFGSLAYRINLLSAFWGATGATLAFLAMRCLSVQRGIAVSVAAGLGLGASFWAHAVFAEAYTQASALTAATLLAALCWDRDGREGWLYAAVACASLAFGTHMIVVGAVPVLVWFVFDRFRWRPPVRVLVKSAAIVMAGVAQYGYVWIRTAQGARYLESSATNTREFLNLLLARQFESQLFRESPLVVLQTRLPGIGSATLVELGAVACVAALVGLAALCLRQPRAAALLALGAAGPALLLSTLGSVATAGILLPAFMPCWILAGVGFGAAWRRIASLDGRPLSRAAGLAGIGLLALSVPVAQARHNFEANDHHHDTFDDDYAVSLFESLRGPTAFVDEDDFRFFHTLKYQEFVTGADDVRVSVPRDPDAIRRLIEARWAVFAFSRGLDALDGRVRVRPVTLLGPSLEAALRQVRRGRIVVVAGSASAWPAMPSLQLGARAVHAGRAVIVAVQGVGPVIVTDAGFEGTVAFRQGEALGGTGLAAPMSIRVDVRGGRASIVVDDQPVADANDGLAVAEIGSRLETAYVLHASAGYRPPLPLWRPLYRIVAVTPADSCRTIGDGAWSGLANPGTEARLIGRVDNTRPFTATWRTYLTSLRPLQARLAGWAGPGEPALFAEVFDPRNDASGLRARLATDGFPDAAPLLAAPSVTRLEVRVNDEGQSSMFRINLGGRPERGWAQARVDDPGPERASVCAGAMDTLVPDPMTLRAGVYLGPGGDGYFGSGWRNSDPAPAGYHRRMARANASLLLPIEQPAAITIRLSIEALHGADTVALSLNGRDAASRDLASGWNALAWEFDAAAWRAGLNELTIHAGTRAGSASAAEVVREATAAGQAPSLRIRSVVLDWNREK